MRITGIYAALAALLVLILAFRVSLARRSAGVGSGDGGGAHAFLARRIRAHGNAIETLPLALLLLLILEINQTERVLVHLFGILLIVARILVAIGLTRSPGLTPERAVGFVLTWLVVGAMSLLLLWQWVVTWLVT